MNLNKQTDICYSQWLNEKINQIKLICLNFDKDTIILYQDENCKTPHKVIKRKDYYENGAVETSLLCKYGDKYFIRISNTMNVIYGWIKKCKKQTLPCN
jgi:hypothetical protein